MERTDLRPALRQIERTLACANPRRREPRHEADVAPVIFARRVRPTPGELRRVHHATAGRTLPPRSGETELRQHVLRHVRPVPLPRGAHVTRTVARLDLHTQFRGVPVVDPRRTRRTNVVDVDGRSARHIGQAGRAADHPHRVALAVRRRGVHERTELVRPARVDRRRRRRGAATFVDIPVTVVVVARSARVLAHLLVGEAAIPIRVPARGALAPLLAVGLGAHGLADLVIAPNRGTDDIERHVASGGRRVATHRRNARPLRAAFVVVRRAVGVPRVHALGAVPHVVGALVSVVVGGAAGGDAGVLLTDLLISTVAVRQATSHDRIVVAVVLTLGVDPGLHTVAHVVRLAVERLTGVSRHLTEITHAAVRVRLALHTDTGGRRVVRGAIGLATAALAVAGATAGDGHTHALAVDHAVPAGADVAVVAAHGNARVPARGRLTDLVRGAVGLRTDEALVHQAITVVVDVVAELRMTGEDLPRGGVGPLAVHVGTAAVAVAADEAGGRGAEGLARGHRGDTGRALLLGGSELALGQDLLVVVAAIVVDVAGVDLDVVDNDLRRRVVRHLARGEVERGEQEGQSCPQAELLHQKLLSLSRRVKGSARPRSGTMVPLA